MMPDPSDDAPVTDRRRSAFCYQTHTALDVIRSRYTGSSRATALAIYLTFTETANRKGGSEARSGFRATRKTIASHAGVGVNTLDRYVKEFEELGLLAVVREKIGEVNLPNRWAIIDAPESVADPLAPLETPPGSAAGALRARSFSEPKNPSEEETPPTPPGHQVESYGGNRNRPKTVDRRPVTDNEYGTAVIALAAFNQLFGTRYSSSDWIAKVVMRIREHPELTGEAHAEVIRRAHADPWWRGPASPSVVYGNAALFERCLHAAPVDVAAQGVSADDAETFGSVWGPGTPYATAAEARAASPPGDFIDSTDHEEIPPDA